MEVPKVELQGTQWAGSCSVGFLAAYKGQLKIMLSSKEGEFSNTEFLVDPVDDLYLVGMCTYAISSKTNVWVVVSDTKPNSDLVAFYIYPSE